MRGFTVVDLSPQGELRSTTHYDYPRLQCIEGAQDLLVAFTRELDGYIEQFELALPNSDGGLYFRWRACNPNGSGIATLRHDGQTLAISLLAGGIDLEADLITLKSFQQHLVRELHDTGLEPAFGINQLWQRPLLVSVGLRAPGPQMPRDRWLFALADRCFAAAYFRLLGLA
ncbi:hypothetical protein [Fontivita pretiosa]|uniref:hypothetical protein n=1 Tax=Fontivita pretiosa TaxID=2989684 RepID=UPI003D166742